MMDCAIKEGWNYYLLGIYFPMNFTSKVDWGGQDVGYVFVQFFLDQCETIGRVHEILVSKNALYCFMIPWVIIQ